jgi:hypothetical protein
LHSKARLINKNTNLDGFEELERIKSELKIDKVFAELISAAREFLAELKNYLQNSKK